MSAIAGIFRKDGSPVEQKRIEDMLDKAASRGPDRSSMLLERNVGFCHGLLITTPESIYESQPVTSSCKNYTITADARIDNRDELIDILDIDQKNQKTISDCEIILNSYIKFRELCAEKLSGTFSFAIWDKPQKKLFCARDHFGIKPLFYYHDSKSFIFASQLNQILANENVKRVPNTGMICEYLNNTISSKEETLYQNVYRLPPAHYLIVGKDSIVMKRYWDIEPGKKLIYVNKQDYYEHFISIFKQSVNDCMRSHNPVGIYLSGGIDSSSVLGMAESLLAENSSNRHEFNIFSLVFPGLTCDESSYISDAARMWNKEAHKLEPKLSDYNWSVNDIKTHMDFPDYPSGSMMKPLIKSAKESNINVMLTGLGGDEWFTGSRYYMADMLKQKKIRTLYNEIKYLYCNYNKKRFLNTVSNYLLRPLIPSSMRNLIRHNLNRIKGENEFTDFLNLDFIKQVNLQDRLNSGSVKPEFKSIAGDEMYAILHDASRVLNLEDEERLSSQFGIEERHPYYNKDVVEYAFSIPEELHIKNFFTKQIIKSSLKDYMPQSILNRSHKTHFMGIIYKTLITNEIRERLKKLKIAEMGWVDQDIIVNKYKKLISLYNRNDRNYFKYIFPISTVYAMEIWYKTIFD